MKKPKAKKAKDLYLDIPFDEALERYAGTSKQELERVLEKTRAKKEPGGRKRKPPGSKKVVTQNVVRLSDRRKRNYS